MLPLTRAEKESMSQVKSHAMKHRLPLEHTLDLLQGKGKPIGDNPKYVCHIQVGKRPYRVAFSVEELPRLPAGEASWEEITTAPRSLARHVSISSPRMPRIEDVNGIMATLGFDSTLISLDDARGEKLVVRTETFPELIAMIGRTATIWRDGKALNVIEFSNDLSN